MPYVIAIDQSTSATKALMFDDVGHCLDRESLDHRQHYPHPGWVEHDGEEIWRNVLETTKALCLRQAARLDSVACVSITNQRETIVVFDKATGRPLCPVIVWHCRRSVSICEAHEAAGHGPLIYARTGLRLDAYFSGSKLEWLISHHPELRSKLESGEALIGTIDTYLIYRLSEGRVFATDPTNASRTLLYDIGKLSWDEELCKLWRVPPKALPEVRESEAQFGETTLGEILQRPRPIIGVMGDSQASLFAQRCYSPGAAKVTFGTGSSVILNIGNKPQLSTNGLVTALAWVRGGVPTYGFEGIIMNSAATLNWLRDQLGLVRDVAEVESLSQELSDAGGVYVVPAFSGFGLPHWEPDARAAIVGLSGYSDRRHVARAALESIAYQLRDALMAMQHESGVELTALRADGGPTANRLLMQFTSDIIQRDLVVAEAPDCSALGATLAGLLGLGVYSSLEAIESLERSEQVFRPQMLPPLAKNLHDGWQLAVRQVLVGVPQKNSSES